MITENVVDGKVIKKLVVENPKRVEISVEDSFSNYLIKIDDLTLTIFGNDDYMGVTVEID